MVIGRIRLLHRPNEEKKQAEEHDNDVLVVTEEIDIESPVKAQGRGELLRLSTKKPAASQPQLAHKPDPVPANGIDTTKRIVRVVHRPQNSSTLDVTVVPQTRSIGVQVGTPAPELGIKPIVVPAPEPPLKSYWTQQVNLPNPPQAIQPMVSGQLMQQKQQYHQQAYTPSVPYAQPHFGQAVAYHQALGAGGYLTRRQKRNFIKRQKYLQRHQ